MIAWLLACGTDPALELEGDPSAGQALYEADCALCHGLAGEGTSRGSDLRGVFGRSDDRRVLEVVRLGVGEMPPFDYTDQELADLLSWMRETL